MSMKRYLLLFLSTALVLGCFTAAGIIFKPESVSVKTWTLEPTCASDQLMCTGTVKRENEKEIVLSQNILVTEVFVKKGDTVTAGQKLFSYQIYTYTFYKLSNILSLLVYLLLFLYAYSLLQHLYKFFLFLLLVDCNIFHLFCLLV